MGVFKTNVDCKTVRIFAPSLTTREQSNHEKVRTDFFTGFEKEPTVLQSKTNVSIFRVKSFYAEIFIMARKFGMGFFGG